MWFGPPSIKNSGYVYGYNFDLPPITVTTDVKGQFYVRLIFGLDSVEGVISKGGVLEDVLCLEDTF